MGDNDSAAQASSNASLTQVWEGRQASAGRAWAGEHGEPSAAQQPRQLAAAAIPAERAGGNAPAQAWHTQQLWPGGTPRGGSGAETSTALDAGDMQHQREMRSRLQAAPHAAATPGARTPSPVGAAGSPFPALAQSAAMQRMVGGNAAAQNAAAPSRAAAWRPPGQGGHRVVSNAAANGLRLGSLYDAGVRAAPNGRLAPLASPDARMQGAQGGSGR
jgi:hypothetical protein